MLGILCKNKAPSTEFSRIFCAGISPPLLGVVLEWFFIKIYTDI